MQPNHTGHKGVVSVAVSAVKGPCVENSVQMCLSCYDEIQLVPVFGSWVPPRGPLTGFCCEECVCYTKLVVGAELEKSLSIFVELSYSKMTNAVWP